MNVKIRLLHNCEDIIATPQYATDGSSGADLYAVNNDEICIKSNQIALIPCGFSMAIPEGYEAQIRQNVARWCQGRSGDKRSQKNIHRLNARPYR